VGYYGQDDFIVLTTLERAEPLARAVIRGFDAVVSDWNSGGNGAMATPSVSIGIVLVEAGRCPHPGQVSDVGHALLRQAKTATGSAFRAGRV